MFLRLRWLVIGIVIGVGSSAWLAYRIRQVRRAITPRSIGRRAALNLADRLDQSGQRLIAR